MPWRCPACRTPIRHKPFEDIPRVGVDYRCHVCRLELELNANTDRLDVTPAERHQTEHGVFGQASDRHTRPVDTSEQILRAIRRQIKVAFRAGIVSEPLDDALTGDVVFHVRQGYRRVKVLVTARVLHDIDNPRDVQLLVKRLAALPDHLKTLKSGASLTITSDGFRT